eukprot:GFYU01016237.1.p1 GENE.GFYU01016237.1~~GFYU01016237.1.p1  ORF type:complete len:288 (+),score=88.83 GFYU01016237.1:124-987(+)
MKTALMKNRDKKEKGKAADSDAPKWRNKQRVLLLSSRGVGHRHRHLMTDMLGLMPHTKKDSKLDTKDHLNVLNEVCELQGCNNCVFLEVRKKRDLYLWMAKTPMGPTMKFQMQNLHTMDELNMTGNCLKGSRPLLSFDKQFDSAPHYQVMKEMFTHIFGVPKGHVKSKPFHDHVYSFYIADNRIWFRNWQIVYPDEKSTEPPQLVEIGPRFVLNPIKIFEGSFEGAVIYENPHYVSPAKLQATKNLEKAGRYAARLHDQKDRRTRVAEAEDAVELSEDELDGVFATE